MLQKTDKVKVVVTFQFFQLQSQFLEIESLFGPNLGDNPVMVLQYISRHNGKIKNEC